MYRIILVIVVSLLTLVFATESFGQFRQNRNRQTNPVASPDSSDNNQRTEGQGGFKMNRQKPSNTQTNQEQYGLEYGLDSNLKEIPHLDLLPRMKQPDEHTCGPTSAVIVIKYYGRSGHLDISTMANKSRTYDFRVRIPGTEAYPFEFRNKDAGYTDPDHLIWAMNEYLPTIMKECASLQDIIDAIDNNKPCIVLVATGDSIPVLVLDFKVAMHYFVIVGYRKDSNGRISHLKMVDTDGKEPSEISRESFERGWNFGPSGTDKKLIESAGVRERTLFIPTRPMYNGNGSKYVPGGPGINAKIKLHEIRCVKQEDYTGGDDIIIHSHLSSEKKEGIFIKTVEDYNNKMWRGPMYSGRCTDLSKTPHHALRQNGTGIIALTEIDNYDPNDQLGIIPVNANETNGGPTTARFTGHSTQYIVTYEIIGDIKPKNHRY